MDFPVEATVHLNVFPSEAEARQILGSHGFALTDLSGDRVRVKGSFWKLSAAKESLERLLSASSPVNLNVSSGAISKHYTDRSRSGSRNKPPRASPSSPAASSSSRVPGSSDDRPTSPENRASPSPRPDRRGSFGPRSESFVVDADVFRYAEHLRKKDIDAILDSHGVRREVREVGDSCSVTLLGKGARTAVGKLQNLLSDLNNSLRTQEVPLKDVDREGEALLERIRKNRNLHNSVLVCATGDKLHLIGPSGESYELKERLLGRSLDRSGRRGRTLGENSRRRSSSLPPIGRKNAEGGGGAVAYPSPVGAAGYSPSKYQDDEREARLDRGGASRTRSQSESREKAWAERSGGYKQKTENKNKPSRKVLNSLLNIHTKDIKQMFKNIRK